MNERIDVLALQATDSKGGLDRHKFAELIVKECMRMCDCADVSLLEHNCPEEASGAAGAKEIIKEWFGVEE